MEEFEEACSILSQHTKSAIPKEQVLNMAHNIDLNKDGHIDFNEFLEAFRIVDQFGHDLIRPSNEWRSCRWRRERRTTSAARQVGTLGRQSTPTVEKNVPPQPFQAMNCLLLRRTTIQRRQTKQFLTGLVNQTLSVDDLDGSIIIQG